MKNLTPRQIQEKLQQGVPLLMDMDLDIDVSSARELMLKLADAGVEKKRYGFPIRLPWTKPEAENHGAALKIKTAPEENTLDVGHILSLITTGDHNAFAAEAVEQGLDPKLLLALARNTLTPAFRKWCRQLSPLAAGIPWHKNISFVCGGLATLAELQGNDQGKHLRCGACGADEGMSKVKKIIRRGEDRKK